MFMLLHISLELPLGDILGTVLHSNRIARDRTRRLNLICNLCMDVQTLIVYRNSCYYDECYEKALLYNLICAYFVLYILENEWT